MNVENPNVLNDHCSTSVMPSNMASTMSIYDEVKTIPTKNYKSCLNAYLNKRKSKNASHYRKVKLCDASSEIRNCYEKIALLRHRANDMAAKIDMSSTNWDQELVALNNEISSTSMQIDKLLSESDDIKKAAKSRQQKRNRIEQRKKQSKHWKNLQLEKRNEKNRLFEEQLKEQANKKSEENQRIEKQQQFQSSLGNIQQKIDEATKQLSFLDSLQKLHQLREREKASKRHSTGNFYKDIDGLRTMWRNALEMYKIEETKQRSQFTCRDWATALFSNQCELVQGEVDTMQKLIANRRLWDEFLTSKDNPWASSVPVGWTIPPSNPTGNWSRYRIT